MTKKQTMLYVVYSVVWSNKISKVTDFKLHKNK